MNQNDYFFSRCTLILILFVIVTVLYYPQFFGFVGTDGGVYYEVTNRLKIDGGLHLWKNYWDHKPNLTYYLIYPFTFLSIVEMESLGIKLAFLTYYILGGAISLLAINMINSKNQIILLISFAIMFQFLLGDLDLVSNGVFFSLSLFLEFSGLVLALYGSKKSHLFFSGLFLGCAPFLRPTSIIACFILVVYFLINFISRKNNNEVRKLARIFITIFLISLILLFLLVLQSGNVSNFFDTFIKFNSTYGGFYRNKTLITDFFTQNYVAFFYFAISFILMIYSFFVSRKKNSFLLVLWACLEIISFVYQRKIQSFYVFGFLLPTLLVFITLINDQLNSKTQKFIYSLFLCFCLLINLNSIYTKYNLIIEGNHFGTQENQFTYLVPQKMASLSCGEKNKNILVYGNRAQLYTFSEKLGILPYKWPVYLNPLVDRSIFSGLANEFMDGLRNDPPVFIVYSGGPGWDPNIDGRILKLEEFINEQYREVELKPKVSNEYPYNYIYRLYINKNCTD
ncbi:MULTISPECIES: hypothetical protein [unclassified Enterobacter]|uniref:hypothetical protein n=1 Tax=unclassified Enterobacter TaxID=2608935 RepID=UPI0015C7E96E|nr:MULTISPECIES: hypothetical protein [unclassified Enterobacter]MBB3304160.1 hypothetical protein [Enterobacter sp. Sphag1F]NYI12735.1 hypothetical protein [Enterobacter sp. Sphag71]